MNGGIKFGDGGILYHKVIGVDVGQSIVLFTCGYNTVLNLKLYSMHNAGCNYKEYSVVFSTNGKGLSLINDNSPYGPGASSLSLNDTTGQVSIASAIYDRTVSFIITLINGTVTFP